MTPVEGKLAVSAAVALWLWWRGRRRPAAPAPTGDVILGVPNVTGPGTEDLDHQGYWTSSDVGFASSDEMQRLIDESTRAILENGGYPE